MGVQGWAKQSGGASITLDLIGSVTHESRSQNIGCDGVIECCAFDIYTNRKSRCSSLKSAVERISVLLLLPLALVLGLTIGLLVRLTSPGPVFFRHRRIGKNGVPFSMLKFRTMRFDVAALETGLQLENHFKTHPGTRQEWESMHKLRKDPRVTRLGAWLRRYSLDELPQLLNVLAGEMSLVGPRPIVAAEAQKYGAHFSCYCGVKPGMTGLWQVSGRSALTYEERVALDCHYVARRSFWMDSSILLRTFKAVMRPDSAF